MPRRSASGGSSDPVDEVIDRLYSLDPDEFTSERNAAAKDLRASGDREGSDRVKALKKPTAVAWAVNQLPRRRPELVDALLEAGAELRTAQRAALSGSEKGGLREATQARRAAVGPLLDEAAAVFRDAGRSGAAHVDAIRSTLEAASSDETTGELVRTGRLTKEIAPSSGLGDVSGFEVLLGGRAAKAPAPKAAARPGARKATADAREPEAAPEPEPEEPGESVAARRMRERLETRLAKAEDAVMAARDKAAEARSDAEATAKEADRLERELETARRRADRSAKSAATAAKKLEDSERALEKAQADTAELL